jgi:Flp pilus assembly pilin Flp
VTIKYRKRRPAPAPEDAMGRMLRGFIADDSGQDLIEYALLTSFIAIVSITALRFLGAKINRSFLPITRAL